MTNAEDWLDADDHGEYFDPWLELEEEEEWDWYIDYNDMAEDY